MDSSATTLSQHHQHQQQKQHDAANKVVVKKQCDIFTPGVKYYLSCRSRRTPSFSSSCSSSLSSLESFCFHDDPTLLMSPASPLIRFSSGVPFSWEHLPGIPKKQNSFKMIKDSSTKLLPLPPPTTTTTTTHSSKKKKDSSSSSSIITQTSFQRDPFFAAMVECSKDDDDVVNDNHHNHEEITSGSNLWSGITDRFGFISLYGSCKNTTCAVSESLVYLPRSRRSNEYQHVSGKFL